MASLKLGNFGQYITGGTEIDYLEIRLGEQYVVPITIVNSQGAPINLATGNWSFTVNREVYTANFAYSGDELSAVSNFTDQGTAGPVSGLEVIIANQTTNTGQATLKIPADTNPSPTTFVTADGDNTMLTIVTITAQYDSSVSSFPSIRKLLIGLVVRFAN